MDHHFIDDGEIPKHERELTLSTGSILALFLGLAVLCGGFFGFGYNMGRKSAPTPLNLSEIATEPSLPPSGATKPAAGSPLDAGSTRDAAGTSDAVSAPAAPTPKPVRRSPPSEPVVASEENAPAAETRPATRPETATPTPALAPVVRAPAPVSPAALNPSATPAAGSSFVVQVAAVSHKDDADLLVGALRARGYSVSARSSAGDSFIHVQIGPFRDKKEADAMRQRLLTDGYNAIVKQ